MEEKIFQYNSSIWFYPQFPKVIPDLRADYRRVTEQSASLARKLAWLSRIPIAATSRRINGYYWSHGIAEAHVTNSYSKFYFGYTSKTMVVKNEKQRYISLINFSFSTYPTFCQVFRRYIEKCSFSNFSM